ncbi:MAG: putative ABC transporter permease [Oscillospiraceae bacterium]|nr:putative ABC transporter permease [Oscillospiraceae bacterium]
MRLSQYIIYFIVYSFLGWVYESLFYSIQFKKPVNTGFLRGCLCPIYGVACVLNISLLGNVESNIHVFLISMAAISLIEYIVSAILENLFDKRWWDYSDWPLNIKGRISLFSSLGFGIMSVAQLRILHPFIGSFVESLPDQIAYAAIIIVSILIAADLFTTIKNMDKADEKLWFIEEESELMQKRTEKFSERKKAIGVCCSNVRERIRDRINR